MDTGKIKCALVDYFRDKATFRRSKADQYAQDKRNHRCAASLELVAKHVNSLNENDPLLARLAKLPYAFFPDGDVFTAPIDDSGQCECDRLAAQCGFHATIVESEFLKLWVETVEEDYEEHQKWLAANSPPQEVN